MMEEILLIHSDYTFQIVALGTGILGLMSGVIGSFTTLQKEKEDLKTKVWDLKVENTHLKKELKDFEKIKAYLGIDKIKELLQTIADKTKKQKER